VMTAGVIVSGPAGPDYLAYKDRTVVVVESRNTCIHLCFNVQLCIYIVRTFGLPGFQALIL